MPKLLSWIVTLHEYECEYEHYDDVVQTSTVNERTVHCSFSAFRFNGGGKQHETEAMKINATACDNVSPAVNHPGLTILD